MVKKIALNEPSLDINEIKSVTRCLKSNWISTAGNLIKKFEKKISNYTGVKYAIACMNGSCALQISLKILGVTKEDEVIVPTLTFISPISAVVLNNANPIFMDVDKYHNIDSKKVIDFIEKKTFFKKGCTFNKKTKKKIKAIIVVHVWGNAVDLKDLLRLCKKRNILLVEDAAEGLGTKYKFSNFKNKHVGSIGALGCLSFNGNKIITTGGGGMILTNNKFLSNRAQYYINQAKDNSLYYVHNEVGYNYRMTNLQAALGLAQFNKLKLFLYKKKIINLMYKKYLGNLINLKILDNPKYSNNNNWMNILEISKTFPKSISQIINIFKKKNIDLRPIWKLNHTQRPFLKYEKYKISNSLKIYSNSICLPSSVNLKKNEIKKICKIIDLISRESKK